MLNKKEIIELLEQNLDLLFYEIERYHGKIVKIDKTELDFTIQMNEENYFEFIKQMAFLINFPCSSFGPLMIDFPRADPTKAAAYHHLGSFKFIIDRKKSEKENENRKKESD